MAGNNSPQPLPSLSHLDSHTANVIQRIITDYPQFTFKISSRFRFHPPKTIFLGPPEPNYTLLALHELGHALCKHKDYSTTIERLKIERAAWERAKTVYSEYVKQAPDLFPHPWSAADDEFVEDQLDTYRNWLHTQSKCPRCGLTRFQTPDGAFHCPHCDLFTL